MKKTESDPMSKFWVDHFLKDPLVDWDVLINSLVNFVQKNYRIKLQELQKNQIKRIIDPNNQQEIKIQSFNNFIDDYWILPINRQKLFKKHFKAVDTNYQNGLKCVQFTLTNKQTFKNITKSSNYSFKNDSLRQGNMSHPLRNKGFVNIGSSQFSDVTLNNIYINPYHAKIFKHPLGYKIKDVSKSNRLKIMISSPVLLKPGMVISVCSYEITIVSLRLNNLGQDNSNYAYVDIPISLEHSEEVQDTTLNFNIKNLSTQQQKKYEINYKKVFRMGKDPSSDAFLRDVMANNNTCRILYNNENWFIQPNQKIGIYLANRRQIDHNLDSASLFIKTGMRVESKGLEIEFKLVKN